MNSAHRKKQTNPMFTQTTDQRPKNTQFKSWFMKGHIGPKVEDTEVAAQRESRRLLCSVFVGCQRNTTKPVRESRSGMAVGCRNDHQTVSLELSRRLQPVNPILFRSSVSRVDHGLLNGCGCGCRWWRTVGCDCQRWTNSGSWSMELRTLGGVWLWHINIIYI